MATSNHRSVEIHGHAIEIDCSVASIDSQISAMLGPSMASRAAGGYAPCAGSIHRFDAKVVRHVSAAAKLVGRTPELSEIYEDGERFWVVDERWGVCEVNFLKSRWRSWIVPSPWVNAFRCFEMAVLWPMAQLLRGRGLHLLPAVSAARGRWGALLISPFGLEPEVSALIRAGYRIVGQSWTAIRVEQERALLLHLAGKMERRDALHSRPRGATRWVDATAGHPAANQGDAYCEAVFVAQHVRRPRAHLRELGPRTSAALLSRCWPIPQLHPLRRISRIPRCLARTSRCCEVQLSENAKDLVGLLETVRSTPAVAFAASRLAG